MFLWMYYNFLTEKNILFLLSCISTHKNSLGVIYNIPEHTKGLDNSKRFCYNFSIEPWVFKECLKEGIIFGNFFATGNDFFSLYWVFFYLGNIVSAYKYIFYLPGRQTVLFASQWLCYISSSLGCNSYLLIERCFFLSLGDVVNVADNYVLHIVTTYATNDYKSAFQLTASLCFPEIQYVLSIWLSLIISLSISCILSG